MIRATLNKLSPYAEQPILELHYYDAIQQFTNWLIAPLIHPTYEDRFVRTTRFNFKLLISHTNESVTHEVVNFMGARILMLKGFWAGYSKDTFYIKQNQTIVP
jgi:hypothetical protein